ncbi:hypothetical protein [Adhaeribacter radiodurans]|uniref:Uncharacterized protein n=1 Tax=Adhaeribacter radiodurans TaxID=2745197 RepID=A0A7L7L5W4_9BACT|nr:hypothetical protein [Adhaeribacter radiodurans]QMU28211.1 hypothetical protein HUW48_09235 [Adhaeribacter radiodurans]
MVKRYTARLVQKFKEKQELVRLVRLLPFLFLVAVLITNTIAWLKGAAWYDTVLNPLLLFVWIVATIFIYKNKFR